MEFVGEGIEIGLGFDTDPIASGVDESGRFGMEGVRL
jgi:hypothetical protein